MRKVIIVRGAPGSGKSTFVKQYIDQITSTETFVETAHFEADMYFEREGEYKFDPTRLKDAHRWCQDAFRNSIYTNCDMIFVSNTFTKLWEVMPYIDLAKEKNYEVVVYHLKTRFENVHGVPLSIVQRMISQYEPFEGEIEVE